MANDVTDNTTSQLAYKKAKRRAYLAAYRKNNSEKVKSWARKYYLANRLALIEKNRISTSKNKEGRKLSQLRWRKSEKGTISNTLSVARSRKNNLQVILRDRVSRRIRIALKCGIKKECGTTELLGCSIPCLRQHIESLFLPGMTWENRNLWHIDHIRPCASFDLTDPEQQRCCFHYSNLQPLWAKDNLAKADKCL